MLELIKKIVSEKYDEEKEEQKILITINSLKAHYQEKLNVNISQPTLRNYGFCSSGILTLRHPDVFTYKNTGSRSYRGMVIDVQAFEEEIGLDYDLDGVE